MSVTETTSLRKKRFLKSFLASVFGTGASRIAGGVRDVVLSNFLGAGSVSDAFFIAFTVPTVFRRFVADEGLTGALIPALAQAEKEDPKAAKRVANTVLAALLIANLVLCVIGILCADWLVQAFAWSFTENPEQYALTVQLTRWLFPFVAMVSLVSFFESLLNHRKHFFVPKMAPGLVSAGIAASAVLLGTSFQQPVYALVVGVLGGGVAHVLVNLPVVWKKWGTFGLCFDFRDPRFRAIARELLKVIAIGVLAQINILVLRQLATSVGDGAVTQYWNANRLVDLSQGIIAVAVGSALLPNISQSVSDKNWDVFQRDLGGAVKLAGFFLVPVALGILVFATPLASMMFRHGMYTWEAALETGRTLQIMAPFLLAVAAINIVKKVYFALEDRNTLFVVGMVGVVLTAILGVVLMPGLGVAGLGAALSLSTTAQLIMYLWVLRRRLPGKLHLSALGRPLLPLVAAAIPSTLILWVCAGFGEWSAGPVLFMNWVIFLVGGGSAVGVYLGGCWLLGVKGPSRGSS